MHILTTELYRTKYGIWILHQVQTFKFRKSKYDRGHTDPLIPNKNFDFSR
jgi:hypothetical protein